MNDEDLAALNDKDLSKYFAIEVAGLKLNDVGQYPHPIARTFNGEAWMMDAPEYATDANSVLPWLEKENLFNIFYNKKTYKYEVEINEAYDGTSHPFAFGETFARAACIALIRLYLRRKK